MRAVILAGGQGKRLYPYTAIIPKPLIPIGDMAIVEVVIRQLAFYGFDQITFAVGYQAELIMALMGSGEKWGVHIDYSLEEKPLNTIGPLRLIQDLNTPFLVMNADLLTDLNFRDLYDYHNSNGSIATVATHKRHVQLQLGVLNFDAEDEGNRIVSFTEKPQFDYHVSMGIYILDPRVIDFIPPNKPFGFDHLMHRLLQEEELVSAYKFSGHWLDMGTPEDLEKAIIEFRENSNRYLPNAAANF